MIIYKVLEAQSLQQLELLVNQELRKGAQLHGSLQVVRVPKQKTNSRSELTEELVFLKEVIYDSKDTAEAEKIAKEEPIETKGVIPVVSELIFKPWAVNDADTI